MGLDKEENARNHHRQDGILHEDLLDQSDRRQKQCGKNLAQHDEPVGCFGERQGGGQVWPKGSRRQGP